jgi:two-component system phosphate regulon sensor histidine kinase PhoR
VGPVDLDALHDSCTQSGTFRTTMQAVNLADIITTAVKAVQPTVIAAGLTLTSKIPPHGVTVNGDPAQLDRLLRNLLSNAAKFTLKGGQIGVTVGASNGTALITISDTGIGIPEAEQPFVLTHFFRATNVVRQAIPGTGLGLTIACTIVANHGGELTIHSHEGEGTTVTVRIPQPPATRVRP